MGILAYHTVVCGFRFCRLATIAVRAVELDSDDLPGIYDERCFGTAQQPYLFYLDSFLVQFSVLLPTGQYRILRRAVGGVPTAGNGLLLLAPKDTAGES